MNINDLYNLIYFWSKSGQQPGTPNTINKSRDAFRETGKVVDDYVLGGTFQANMRGQDALLRQLLINGAVIGAGAGVGVGASRVAPRISALRQWIKPRDIGVHISPFDDLGEILPNINLNKGAGEIQGFPLVKGQTYKLSSSNAYNVQLTPEQLVNSVETYLPNVKMNPMGNKNIYVTKSPKGLLDPEHQNLKNLYDNGQTGIPGSLNARMIPHQQVVGKTTLNISQGVNKINDELKKELARFIAKQRSFEKVKSIGRGSVVGGSAVGTALTPLAVARPALGSNNNKNKKLKNNYGTTGKR